VGRVRSDDLHPFAVADGLLARIAAERPGKLTDDQHEVSVYLNGRPLFPPITRARLRGVVHPGAN
jgi:hypothetical protein